MKIIETDLAWRCIFFPNAIDTNVKDEKEKGYVVQFGEVEGEAVPKFIDYLKDKFSLELAIQYAKNIKECGICKSLNSQVDVVESVTVKDQYERPKADIAEAVSALKEEVIGLKKKLEGPPERRSAAKDLYQKIASDMFKSQFSKPGLVELALIFDDESFIEDLLPDHPSEEDMLELRADMADFWSGDIGRYRTPEQMRAYAKAQRDMVKTLRGEKVEDEGEEKTTKRRKLGKRVKIVA
jgi:hypothetical protein